MGMYLTGTKAVIYKGNYSPANLYRCAVKAAGWKTVKQTGMSMSWDGTYNDTVLSAAIQGASTQGGTPAPDAPIDIISIGYGGINFAVSGYAGQSCTASRTALLRGLPDGTHDDYDAVSGVITRRIGVRIFRGTETWYYVTNQDTQYASAIINQTNFGTDAPSITYSLGFVCTHFAFGNDGQYTYNNRVGNLIYGYQNNTATVIITFDRALLGGVSDATAWKAWLAAQYDAGTPVTVLYPLAIPMTEQLDHVPLPTYPRRTTLTCSVPVKASARVADADV